VTWTIADGSKGRRWRETVVDRGGVRHSLLLETAPDRRFGHLELATPDALLTLHPERDGTLHGNLVAAAGVRHVVGLPWERDGLVDLEGSPIAAAAAAWFLDGASATAAPSEATVVGIDASLALAVHRAAVSRLWDGSWRIDGGSRLAADLEGLPALAEAESWPLERVE
jgi:hypothetical protein